MQLEIQRLTCQRPATISKPNSPMASSTSSACSPLKRSARIWRPDVTRCTCKEICSATRASAPSSTGCARNSWRLTGVAVRDMWLSRTCSFWSNGCKRLRRQQLKPRADARRQRECRQLQQRNPAMPKIQQQRAVDAATILRLQQDLQSLHAKGEAYAGPPESWSHSWRETASALHCAEKLQEMHQQNHAAIHQSQPEAVSPLPASATC